MKMFKKKPKIQLKELLNDLRKEKNVRERVIEMINRNVHSSPFNPFRGRMEGNPQVDISSSSSLSSSLSPSSSPSAPPNFYDEETNAVMATSYWESPVMARHMPGNRRRIR